MLGSSDAAELNFMLLVAMQILELYWRQRGVGVVVLGYDFRALA